MPYQFLHNFNIDLIGNQVGRLFDILPELVYVWDLKDYKLSYVSPKITTLLGYSLEDISGMRGTFLPIIVHHDLAKFASDISKNLAKLKLGEQYEFMIDFRHKDGSVKKFRNIGAPLTQDYEGNNEKIVLVAQDITEQVLRENTLQTNIHYLSQSEQIFPYGSFDWIVGEPQAKWTDGLFRLFGICPEKYVNGLVPSKLYSTFIPKGERAKVAETVQKYIGAQTPYYEIEHPIVDANLTEKQVILRVHLFTHNNQIIMKGNVIDVTKERIREAQLGIYIERLQRQQTQMVEAESIFNFGSWEWDINQSYIQCSDGFFELLQISNSPHSKQMQIRDFKNHIYPEDWPSIKKAIDEILAKKEIIFEVNHRIITAEGEIKYATSRAKYYYDEHKTLLKCVGVTADVTLLENYKRKLEYQLTEISKSNKELEQFAYIASHDLQEPLRKIIAFGERLEKKFKDNLGEEGQFFIARMINASQRMNHLIEGLLSYSRASRQMEDVKEVSLQEIINHILDDLEIKIQEKRAKIIVNSLPTIEAQPIQMQQLFQNLIENALKFSSSEVNLIININAEKVKQHELHDLPELNQNLTYHKIIVADNGIGFEPQYAEKIFTIFQRLHGRSEYEGTGLGLAICRKIVETHHGFITASGELNQGATFTIYLPTTQSKLMKI